MILYRCEYCDKEATHTNSVPDRNKPGINHGECGYTIIYLCSLHALESARDNCSRVQMIDPANADVEAESILGADVDSVLDAYMLWVEEAKKVVCAALKVAELWEPYAEELKSEELALYEVMHAWREKYPLDGIGGT